MANEVAARVAAGEVEAEVTRLKALGFGRKARAGAERAPQPPRSRARGELHRRKRAAADDGSDADADSSDESSDNESDSEEEEDDEIDIDELLQKDEDVYEVEKLLNVRSTAGASSSSSGRATRPRCRRVNRHWAEMLCCGPKNRHWALECQPKAGHWLALVHWSASCRLALKETGHSSAPVEPDTGLP